MNLKTATLIAVICVGTHFILNLIWALTEAEIGYSLMVRRVFWIFNLILFDGGFALFFAVLYYKQKR